MNTDERSLEEILQSCSDVLFPADIGEAKVSIDSKSVDGDTPLHVLAWREDVNGIELVIKAGANVDASGDMGETPLHIATRKNNLEISELLLKAGAKTNIKSEFGKTSSQIARENGGKLPKLFEKYNNT